MPDETSNICSDANEKVKNFMSQSNFENVSKLLLKYSINSPASKSCDAVFGRISK